MRNRNRDKYNERIARIIAANYDLLHIRCARAFRCGPFLLDDVIQETSLYVMTDPRAANITADADVVDYFVYKFRMIAFQTMKNNRKMLRYADDQKIKKTESED